MPTDIPFDESGFGGGRTVPLDRGIAAGQGDDPTVYHVLVLGQSNANGSSTTSPTVPNLVVAPPEWTAVGPSPLMLAGGTRPGSSATATYQFRPLAESTGGVRAGMETVLSGCLWRLSRLTGGRFVGSVHAVDGSTHTSRGKGTATYTEMLACVRAGRELARRAGRPYRVLACLLLEGEGDQQGYVSGPAYSDVVLASQQDHDRDLRAATGQGEAVPWYFAPQTAYRAAAPTADAARTAFQAYLAHRTDPQRMVLGPATQKFGGQQNDGSRLHYHALAQRWMGEEFATPIYERQFLNRDWRPVVPRVGEVNFSSGPGGSPTASVVVNFHAPHPPLALDYTHVLRNATAGEIGGFSYTDDTSPPPVTAVTLTGPTQVTLTLSGTPTGTAASRAVRGGWGTTSNNGGPLTCSNRINLRDSNPTVGTGGFPLHNWCHVFSEAVT